MADPMDEILDDEKVLDEEIVDENEEPGEVDALPPDEKKVDEPTLEEKLEATALKLEDLEKSNKGLRGAVTGERTKRQETQAKLDQLSGTLNEIISQRKEREDTEEKATGIKVEVDEDGNAFIPQEAVSGTFAKEISALSDKIDRLSTDTTQRTEEDDREKESQKVYGKIVAEDGAYQDASRILSGMVEWADERIIPLLNEKGIETQPTAGQILDLLDETSIEKDFQVAYPGTDMEKVVRAFSSKRDYRVALKHLSKVDDKKDKDDPAKLKALVNKGNNLSNVQNQKTTTGLTLDQIANIDPEDFENLSDAEADKLENFMKKEELRG